MRPTFHASRSINATVPTWEVVAGTAHLRLRISDPYWESTGELRLVGVEMRSSDGLDVTVDDIGWTDVLVGTEQG